MTNDQGPMTGAQRKNHDDPCPSLRWAVIRRTIPVRAPRRCWNLHVGASSALGRRSLGFRWALAIALFAILATPVRPETGEPGDWAVVRWVADGDTVILADGRRVRYRGINCPEVAHGDQPAEPLAEDARRLNQDLVGGRRIRLIIAAPARDRYGRHLADVLCEDGTPVNRVLVAAGLAFVLFGPNGTPPDAALLAVQRAAMAAGQGLWARLPRMPVALVGNRRSRRFHRPDCSFAKKIGERHKVPFPDLVRAFDTGYAPCRHCFGRLEQIFMGK